MSILQTVNEIDRTNFVNSLYSMERGCTTNYKGTNIITHSMQSQFRLTFLALTPLIKNPPFIFARVPLFRILNEISIEYQFQLIKEEIKYQNDTIDSFLKLLCTLKCKNINGIL